jgi:hypothetical protein
LNGSLNIFWNTNYGVAIFVNAHVYKSYRAKNLW